LYEVDKSQRAILRPSYIRPQEDKKKVVAMLVGLDDSLAKLRVEVRRGERMC